MFLKLRRGKVQQAEFSALCTYLCWLVCFQPECNDLSFLSKTIHSMFKKHRWGKWGSVVGAVVSLLSNGDVLQAACSIYTKHVSISWECVLAVCFLTGEYPVGLAWRARPAAACVILVLHVRSCSTVWRAVFAAHNGFLSSRPHFPLQLK